MDKTREYIVTVDDKNIGEIKDGMTNDFEILAGENTIYLEIDWYRGNKVTLLKSK